MQVYLPVSVTSDFSISSCFPAAVIRNLEFSSVIGRPLLSHWILGAGTPWTLHWIVIVLPMITCGLDEVLVVRLIFGGTTTTTQYQ